MLRAMIDTMVFDAIADDAALWPLVDDAVRHHRLLLVSTPVQERQVAAVPDAQRRRHLQGLPREVVPDDDPPDPVGRHRADARIAETARRRCDVLVTEDKRLLREEAGAWDVEALRAWLLDAA